MSKPVVQFLSAKLFLNQTDEEFNKTFFCLHGRREVVVECNDELKETLKNLPSDYLQPRLKDIKAYLDANNISYVEDFKNTTVV